MVKIDWVEIPGGEFWMGLSADQVQDLSKQMLGHVAGDPEGILSWEASQYTVHVPTFYISRFPITRRQFAEFILNSHTQFDIPPYHEPEWADHPVACVWHLARAFCAWIGTRLPSSAEWEKAARGTDGRLYPWGNDWDLTRGNFGQSGRRGSVEGLKTSAVGAYPEGASPYGVCDLVGNSFEWTMSFSYPNPRYSRAMRYRQLIIVRGSDPDPEALHPVNHRVTRTTMAGPFPESAPVYTGFRPVMDEWQRQYWSGFRVDKDLVERERVV